MTIALLVSPGSLTEKQGGISHKSERKPKETPLRNTTQGRASLCPNSSRFRGNGSWPMNVGERDAENGLEGCCKASG